ncbi:ABC-three component system protein [Clostridium diolis]|uniref:ABC-three component system protein n=1 Tax=Clostridium diolis TaxID=223919 RepID=UPI003AF503E5
MYIGSQSSQEDSTINNIENQYNYFNNDEPLRFYEKDIKDIIVCFSNEYKSVLIGIGNDNDFSNIPLLEEKNELNNLSNEYFEEIKDKHMMYFFKIDAFLKDPKNKAYLEMYTETADELKCTIIANRERYSNFDKIFPEVGLYILTRHEEVLRSKRKLIYAFLHYMYCNCDIGRKTKKEGKNDKTT